MSMNNHPSHRLAKRLGWKRVQTAQNEYEMGLQYRVKVQSVSQV